MAQPFFNLSASPALHIKPLV